MRHHELSLARALWLAPALFVGAGLAGSAGASISGVCPDGSIFIVQSEADIPCAAAKRVEPDEIPPIKPQLLPRPYAWEVYQQQQDPNNPYNLVDRARAVRASELAPEDDADPDSEPQAGEPPQSEPPPTVSSARQPAPLPPVSAAPPGPAQLTLSPQEKRDLALIVELTQQRAPAAFEHAASGAAPTLIVRLAHSQAFEARLHEFWAARGEPLRGPVVLFSVDAAEPGDFWANFTFAQGHTAFHASPDDPRQMGLIDGSLGPLAAGDAVLGYVALPAAIDIAQPMDVYWNDRRLVATLRP